MKIVTYDMAVRSGLKKFFTGEPCRKGHIAERYVLHKQSCVECDREHHEKKMLKNNGVEIPESIEVAKRQARKEAKRKNLKQYFTGHPCSRGHVCHRYTSNNACVLCIPVQPSMTVKRKTPQQIREKKLAAKKKRKERLRLKGRIKNHKRRKVIGSFTVKQFTEKLKSQDYKCAICGTDLINKKYEADHIKPISKGGDNYIANIQALCRPCNQKKSNQYPYRANDEGVE